MQTLTVILAAGWIEWAGPVVVFILYTIGQLVMNQGKKPAQQQQRPPQRPRPAVPPQQQPRTLEEKLRSEVEDFLRQVQGEKPKQPEASPKPLTQRPVVVKVERPIAKVVEPERVSVQEHVARHISTADVTQHVAALGAEVSQTDERFEAQLQGKFQHQIGALEPRQQQQPTAPRQRRSAAATEIANLLRSPQGMRQVIVASEILRRPEF